MNKKVIWSIVALIIIIVLAVIFFRTPETVEPTISGGTVTFHDKVVINASLALTGNAAAMGEAAKNGAQLAVDEINVNGGIDFLSVVLDVKDNKSSQPNTFSIPNLTIYPDTDVAKINSPKVQPGTYSTWYRDGKVTFTNDFEAKYAKVYKRAPEYGASTAYDAIYMIARAIKAKPTNIDVFMRGTNFLTATYGNVTMDEMGGVHVPEAPVKK